MELVKKADIYIILFIFLIISASFFASFFNMSHKNGDTLNIIIDGKITYSYEIPFSEKQVIEIDNSFGYNKIIAEGNSVYVENSDCNGKDCIKMGKINSGGDFIICIPHKLLIEIENHNKEGLDAITY